MKKVIGVILSVVMGLSILVGCGSNNDVEKTESNDKVNESKEDSSSKAAEKTKIVIDLDKYSLDYPDIVKAVEEVQQLEKYANVEFEILPYDADYKTTLPIAISSGEQRDILCVRSDDWLKEWAEAGIIQPIDEFVDTAGVDYDTEYGEYKKDCMVGDQIYAIPNGVNQWSLYYNKKVFDDAGVEYPDPKIPMTWDEYNELAAKLTSGEGENKVYGALEVEWPQFWYGEALITYGGPDCFYTEDGEASNIEDPIFAKALEAKYNRMHVDESIPTYADIKVTKTQVNAFLNGKYGMIVQGGWMLGWLSDKETYPRDWKAGIAPMPVDEGTKLKTWGSLNYLTIGKTSVNPQLAYEIAKDIEDTACKYATRTNANRVIEQPKLFVETAKLLAEDDITLEDILYLYDNNDIERYSEKVIGKNSVDYLKVINEETELYFVKEQDLETTIKNIKERGDEVIQGK